MTLSDFEWFSDIFNDTKHRTVSLQQLSILYEKDRTRGKLNSAQLVHSFSCLRFIVTCLHHSCDLIRFFAWHFTIGRNVNTCSVRYNLTVSEFLAGIVDVNAVVRQYCCSTETEDRVRAYQFMRDLIACRDWYNRDSRCILSRNEICDVINF